jgi:hypothetical protein
MLSPPTGQLRRDSSGSLSPEEDMTLENFDEDQDWDTDLEMDGTIKITLVSFYKIYFLFNLKYSNRNMSLKSNALIKSFNYFYK